MNPNRRILITLNKMFDLVVMVAAFAVATYLTFDHHNAEISLENFLSMRIRVQNLILFLALLFCWQLIFSAFGLYHSKRLSSQGQESRDVVKATTAWVLACWAAAAVFDISMITPEFIFLLWAMGGGVCVASRLLRRQVLKWLRRRGHNLRFMLIVGTNERALGFSKRIESRPELGYSLLGFVENGWKGNQAFQSSGHRTVTDFNGFSAYVRENVVDEVVVCLPVRSLYNQILTISRTCEEQGITFRHFSDFYDSKRTRSRADQFEGETIVTHYTGSMAGWPVLIKRIVDVLGSLFLLVACAPLFLALVLLIKATSPGPVFFAQQRVGLNKRRFDLYKFRTMVPDAEERQAELEALNEQSGPVFKIKNDPRITPIGRILRKTSLDELPQLLNVLAGDMSLVGPRALPVRDYNGFNQDWHRRRVTVRPGITCLWQVNGRNDIPFEQWMELDLEYIDNWSLWLDLKILAKTVPAVLSGSGAA